jgi:hypothetical protein
MPSTCEPPPPTPPLGEDARWSIFE